MPSSTTTPAAGLKVATPRKDLLEGVQTVSKAVATRTSLPILGHVLITQDEQTGQVRLTATDLEMWIEHTLPRSQESLTGATFTGGATTAPAKNLTDLLAALPEATVEITATGIETSTFTTHVRCNRANFKLLALNADEFPVLPEVAVNTRLVINKAELRDAVKQVLFAVSTDASRVILTGVLLVYRDGVLRLVATDTHRLAVREITIIEGTTGDTQAVIPARAMSELLRVIGSNDDEGTISLVLSDNQVQFRTDDETSGSGTTLISRLIEGQFPNYERVVPQGFDRKITLERELFVAALKRAAIFAREQGSANRVVIRSSEDSDGDRLIITAISDTLGTAMEEVEIAREGATDSVEIAFNVKYLIDVLNAIEGDGVHLELTAPLRPGVVRPTEGTNYFCVLMPMQVV